MSFWFDSLMTELVVAAIFLVIAVFFYTKYTFSHWTRNGIVQLPPSFPFGNAKGLLLKNKTFGNHFKDMYNTFKTMNVPYGGYYFMFRPEILLVDPDFIKQIFIKDFQYFTNRGTFLDEENDPITGHLFSLTGNRWRHIRTKLSPTFTSGKMKMMFGMFVDCARELNLIVEEKSNNVEPIEMKDILSRFTSDVIGSCAFGINMNCLRNPNTEFRSYGNQVFQPQGIDVVRTFASHIFPNFFRFFKIPGVNRKISKFFMNVVKDMVKYREDNNIFRRDFMQLMIQLKNEGNVSDDDCDVKQVNGNGVVNEAEGLTMKQIAAQCFVFFLAGFETSATTMTFCLYELVSQLDIQDKLREEINTVLNKSNGEVTYEGIMEMNYLDKCVNETLRKYPPLSFLMRECSQDYKLPKSNYIVRKGCMIRVAVLGLHRDPEFYPDPERFDPERFSEKEKAKRLPFTFLPFGEGPRICIGARFGLMMIKIALVVLLRNYKFTLNDKTTVPLIMEPGNIIMSTKDGIWFNVHKVVS